MSKKYLMIAVVTALLACLGSSALAEMYNGQDWHFVDKIDTWSEWNDAGLSAWGSGEGAVVWIYEGTDKTYTHTIDGFSIPDEYLVTEAHLELDFTNDDSDSFNLEWSWADWALVPPYDCREYVRLAFNGSEWIDIGEQNNGEYLYDLYVYLDLLNENGSLDVAIQAYNYVDGIFNTADLSLDHSVLYGNVEAVPVPGAVVLGMLGLSVAGARLRKRRA